MTRNFKIFLTILASSFFWWGINIFAQKTEDFFYIREAFESEQFLAQASSYEQQLARLKPTRIIVAEELDITARSAMSVLIKEDGQEKILFEENIKERLPIASVTKLMTALVVSENYNLKDVVEISPAASEVENEYGSGNLKVSEKFFVKDLLYFSLIESNNGAAFALAELIGENNFVDLMNIKAAEMGLKSTFFVNPTGLDPEEASSLTNYSTVEDIAKLAIYISKEKPLIWDIARNQNFDVNSADGILFRQLKNTNELLGAAPSLSGKTGWTLRAGGCLVVIYRAPDRSGYIVNVVLSSEDRFGDVKRLMDWLENAYRWN